MEIHAGVRYMLIAKLDVTIMDFANASIFTHSFRATISMSWKGLLIIQVTVSKEELAVT